MKQVYPSVRPRRLGTRGNSRYCYAGLRKRFKLEVPQLPDLGEKSKESRVQSPSELSSAAWYIVQKWAEDVLGKSFVNVCSLAVHLVKNVCPFNSNHANAASLLCSVEAENAVKGNAKPKYYVLKSTIRIKHVFIFRREFRICGAIKYVEFEA